MDKKKKEIFSNTQTVYILNHYEIYIINNIVIIDNPNPYLQNILKDGSHVLTRRYTIVT